MKAVSVLFTLPHAVNRAEAGSGRAWARRVMPSPKQPDSYQPSNTILTPNGALIKISPVCASLPPHP